VLVNLIGNALKFTHQGSVTVSVKGAGEEGARVGLRFAVSDTGIGIPRHLHDRVFRPYAQAEASTSRKYGGTGLGLSIASKIAELMGGKLELESEPGQGTTFAFVGQLQRQVAEELARPEAVALADLRILVVDGDPTSRSLTESLVGVAGVRPMLAPSGQAAIALLRAAARENAPVSLALLDVVLPDADGFQLAEEIRHDPELSSVRLILLTSAGQRGDAARCLGIGVSGYLSRPLEADELLDAARMVMAAPPHSRSLVTRHTVREARVQAP
ncbi:MAG: ATP-binding protein, partial [Candidatus Eremiobacterota bacterium]